jgi:dimethylhistidine N-methyltransferase
MLQITLQPEILIDTMKGLSANPKYLLPKYFYDDIGSRIFQDIMQMPEYYLTDCEHEIFITQQEQITDLFGEGVSYFDLIELGSGDGIKTKILLKSLVDNSVYFNYIPVDISHKANSELVKTLNKELPSLTIHAKTGDYFQVFKQLNGYSGLRKIILFLGSNIGNFTDSEISLFLSKLSEYTHKGDKVLIGFDLKKSPDIIMHAYNDPHGHTRNFNLNHLTRLNNELGANFNIKNFEQHTEYNPASGEVKSFLVSKTEQTVTIDALNKKFQFKKWEPVFMELSRKFDLKIIESLAAAYGFNIEQHFSDRRNYFVDSLWIKK